jgi:hypothetical protein
MELYNNLRETFLEIEHIKYKIDILKKFQEAGDYSDIRIHFNSGQIGYVLRQLNTDISLINELRLLIQASIDLYEQQILDLKLNF